MRCYLYWVILVLRSHHVAVYTGVIAAFLFALAYAFDGADGQLARLTRTGGPSRVNEATTLLTWARRSCSTEPFCFTDPACVECQRGTGSSRDWLPTVSVVAFFAWLLVDLLRQSTPVSGRGT